MTIDTKVSLEELNTRCEGSMVSHLSMRFTDIQAESLSASMPVDERTKQPLGLLHGGASAALAETVGSMAAYLSIDREQQYCVGLEMKCNHVKGATGGIVTGTARPLHVGRRTQVWQIEVRNEAEHLVCFSTLTVAVIDLPPGQQPLQ